MGVETLSQPSEFDQKVQFFREFALENRGIAPTLIVEGDKATVMSNFQEMPNTHEGRAQMMFILGVALVKESNIGNIKQVWFASEAWMSKVSKDSPPPILPPSQDPNRIEILCIWNSKIVDGELINKGAIFEMKRNEIGALSDLQVIENMTNQEGHKTENSLVGSFFKGYRLGLMQTKHTLN